MLAWRAWLDLRPLPEQVGLRLLHGCGPIAGRIAVRWHIASRAICQWRPRNEIILYPRHPKETLVSQQGHYRSGSTPGGRRCGCVVLGGQRRARARDHRSRVRHRPRPRPNRRRPRPAPTGGASLPALANSDTPFNAALLALPGAQALANLVRPENMIRHLVATVDNLPRHKLAVELRPLEPTSGTLLVVGGDLQATLDEHNATRYAPVMAILEDLDMHAVNGLYRHYYPLFQRAYEDLGYPQKSFNDRLLATIDDLLADAAPGAPPGAGAAKSVLGICRSRISKRVPQDRNYCCVSAPRTRPWWSGSCASCGL